MSFKKYKSGEYEVQEQQQENENNYVAYGAMAEELIYYYHPDHLGTATYLTDINGEAYEFFLNLPFGETMAEQHSMTADYVNRWKFTGHELDRETGLYYANARYYDPKRSIWLSVDPLAEKFFDRSPYEYTFSNPIRFIDPDGRSSIDPIREILFSTSCGNTKSFSVDKSFRVLPASNHSWSGISMTGSVLKDRINLVSKILGVGSQYARSTTLTTTNIKGQYFNNQGEMVDNIADANKLIISKNIITETVNLNEFGIKDEEITVNEHTSVLILDVIDGKHLSFSERSFDSITKKIDLDKGSNNFIQLINDVSTSNESLLKGDLKTIQLIQMNSNTENMYQDMIRESNQNLQHIIID